MARMQCDNRDLLVWVDETGSDHREHMENGMLFVVSTQCATACLKEVPMCLPLLPRVEMVL